jgi:excinuclease ABC subunit A
MRGLDKPSRPSSTEATCIPLRGVCVHNLKSVNVDIPLNRLTVITGVSGSGKSSLAFDTLYAEGQRRYIETFSPAARQHLEVLEKPSADFIGQIPPAIALRQNSVSRTRQATISTATEVNDLLRALLARAGTVVCPNCRCEVVSQTPAAVVRHLAELPDGVRYQLAFPVELEGEIASPDEPHLLQQLLLSGYSRGIAVQPSNGDDSGESLSHAAETILLDQLSPDSFADPVTELYVIVDRLTAGRTEESRLTESVEACFRDGNGRCLVIVQSADSQSAAPDAATTQNKQLVINDRSWLCDRFSRHRECPGCSARFEEPNAASLSFRSPNGACPDCAGSGQTDSQTCPACNGTRLSEQALAVCLRTSFESTTTAGDAWLCLGDLEGCSVEDLTATLERFAACRPSSVAGSIGSLIESALSRLKWLSDAGLGYLELNRPMSDLARGEAQRVALTAILSSQLVNSLFVLDEPSSGLHVADLAKVLDLTLRLRDEGNTVVVVEHEPDFIRAADHVIEIGPGSGASGGEVVFADSIQQLLKQQESPTAECLRSDSRPARSQNRPAGTIRLEGCRHHNLRNVSVEFPLGCLCVVTGVSGSGKTSLVEQTLYPALSAQFDADGPPDGCGVFDKLQVDGDLNAVHLVDDRPLKASRRSSPVTWLKLLTDIRTLFADTPDARNRNLTAGHFSFNSDSGGRCPKCAGTGIVEIDMQFMADVTMTCPDCHGTRYLPHILEVSWRNRTIADVLAMTVDEAFGFFRGERRIQKKLVALRDVGLGYLPLGQLLSTLSGGEAQRLKLAGRLAATKGTGSLLILNEPTTGLHPVNVRQLLDCFHRLLSAGHSLIVIEHHRDVIQAADHLIDMGPSAGPHGGRVIAAGTPAEVAGQDLPPRVEP